MATFSKQLLAYGVFCIFVSRHQCTFRIFLSSSTKPDPGPSLNLGSQRSQQSTRTRMLGGNYLRQALCCSDPFKAFEYVPALMNGFPMQAGGGARQGKAGQRVSNTAVSSGFTRYCALDKSLSKILNKKNLCSCGRVFWTQRCSTSLSSHGEGEKMSAPFSTE